MDLTSWIADRKTITRDLIVYVPIVPLQNGLWLAVKQLDVGLTDAVQLWLVDNTRG